MEPEYLARPEAARMAQHFEAMNEPQIRVDTYLRVIHWARVAVVLAIVGAAVFLWIPKAIGQAAHDAAEYGVAK